MNGVDDSYRSPDGRDCNGRKESGMAVRKRHHSNGVSGPRDGSEGRAFLGS